MPQLKRTLILIFGILWFLGACYDLYPSTLIAAMRTSSRAPVDFDLKSRKLSQRR
jgi:hypothetical protein